jgi:hypothetical protein
MISLKEIKLFFLGLRLGQAYSIGFLITINALSVIEPLESIAFTSLD